MVNLTCNGSRLWTIVVGMSFGLLLALPGSAGAVSVSSAPTGDPSDGPVLFSQMFMPGDANGDGTVDLDDFSTVKNNFGISGATWAQGDFDSDGEVNLTDFGILKSNFGKDWHEADSPVIPEPLTMMGMGLAVASLVGYVRKRRVV